MPIQMAVFSSYFGRKIESCINEQPQANSLASCYHEVVPQSKITLQLIISLAKEQWFYQAPLRKDIVRLYTLFC